jgi:hypothetical protein
VLPDFPFPTRFAAELEGRRSVLKNTILVEPGQNLRSNTGDDMAQKAFAADTGSGASVVAKKVNWEKFREACAAAGMSKADVDKEKADKENAKAAAKLEREMERERERERKRLEAERAREVAREQRETKKKEDESRTASAAFLDAGAGKARTSKSSMGSKRYQVSTTTSGKRRANGAGDRNAQKRCSVRAVVAASDGISIG